MRPAEYLFELTLPLRSPSAVLTGLALFVCIGLVMTLFVVNPIAGFALLLLLVIGVAPGITRYLVSIAAWRAQGYDIAPPTTETFTLLGSFWQLLPLLLVVVAGAGLALADIELPRAASFVLLVAFAIAFAAVVGVLVITHSPIEALNPIELVRLLRRAGRGFWYAPATACAAVLVTGVLTGRAPFIAVAFGIYSAFAFFAVTGAVLRDRQLIEAVELPRVAVPPADKVRANADKLRRSVLTHAYGFASRGNPQSAIDHIDDALGRDPDPDRAERWYFDRMLEWENRDHALFYAQRYLSRLLARNERVVAVKLMLRAQMENERFRPLPEDLPLAIEAAENTGNEALADRLRRL
jgi:hypothetical protein